MLLEHIYRSLYVSSGVWKGLLFKICLTKNEQVDTWNLITEYSLINYTSQNSGEILQLFIHRNLAGMNLGSEHFEN